MFSSLTAKLQEAIASLSGKGKLTDELITDAIRQVRLALLEADVNYSVAKEFIKKVKEKALGQKLIKAVSAEQLFIKIIHDELVSLMGQEECELELHEKPSIVMVCGLQGSGKTTFCAKLAKYLKRLKKVQKPLIAACDLQRPAAVQQLHILGDKAGVDVFSSKHLHSPQDVAKEALLFANQKNYDLLIVDTAGRLHVDDAMMIQLQELRALLNPQELLFVANATSGQDAVRTASTFHGFCPVTGFVLTMLDGDARAGAAISIRQVTKSPLKFEGIGEKLNDLQLFNPHSMADRILGMGDTVNLVKKAQEHINQQDAEKLEKKLRKATFNYEDYLKQVQMIKKMGSFSSLLKMIPGFSQFSTEQIPEKEMHKVETIILSMTPNERKERVDLELSRRKRIARGSGTKLEDVNKLVKSFKHFKKMFKNLSGKMTNKKQKLFEGTSWL